MLSMVLLAMSTLSLSCVSSVGENAYQAMDRTLIITSNCHHKAECEPATLVLGSYARIRFGGASCRVIQVLLPEED